MKIYVLVLVNYNYYRFQENLFVGTKEQCLDEINRLFTNFPILEYDDITNKLNENLSMGEVKHYWLQEFEVNLK